MISTLISEFSSPLVAFDVHLGVLSLCWIDCVERRKTNYTPGESIRNTLHSNRQKWDDLFRCRKYEQNLFDILLSQSAFLTSVQFNLQLSCSVSLVFCHFGHGVEDISCEWKKNVISEWNKSWINAWMFTHLHSDLSIGAIRFWA